MLALGVDVSIARGLDIVALDQDFRPHATLRKQSIADLVSVIRRLEPSIVAIDSPPGWSTEGSSRPIERQLARLGINIFATPSAPAGRGFYSWMAVGFQVFEAAAQLGYPAFAGLGTLVHTCIEVFPHASAVTLRGSVPASNVRKRVWRRQVLEDQGVRTDALVTVDQLDAALAAFTGIRALQGKSCWVGTPREAVLVLPIRHLPARRYLRDVAATSVSPPARGAETGSGPGSNSCACGCGPGHSST